MQRKFGLDEFFDPTGFGIGCTNVDRPFTQGHFGRLARQLVLFGAENRNVIELCDSNDDELVGVVLNMITYEVDMWCEPVIDPTFQRI
jgi:hypothetical protein